MRRKAGGILVLFVLCGLCLLLYRGLRRFGVVGDSQSSGLFQNIEKMERPVIYASDRKVTQGEKVPISELGSAYDGDGTDLHKYLKIKTVSGMAVHAIHTEKAGIFDWVLWVQSPVTGKKAEKYIRILVDGKVGKR